MRVPIFSGKWGHLGAYSREDFQSEPGKGVFFVIILLPMVTNTRDRVYIFFPRERGVHINDFKKYSVTTEFISCYQYFVAHFRIK